MSLSLKGLRRHHSAKAFNTTHDSTRLIFTSPRGCRVGGGPPWPLLPSNLPPLPPQLASRRTVEPAWKRAQKPKSAVRHGARISPRFANFSRVKVLESSPVDMSSDRTSTDTSSLEKRFFGFRRPQAIESTLKLLRPATTRSMWTTTHRGYHPQQGMHRLGLISFSSSTRTFPQHKDAASGSSSVTPDNLGSNGQPELTTERIRRETLVHQQSMTARRIISSKYADDFSKIQPKGSRSLLHANHEESQSSNRTETVRLAKLYQRLNELHSSDMSSGSLHYTGDDFHPEPPKLLPARRPIAPPKGAPLLSPRPAPVSENSQKARMNPLRMLAGVAQSAVTAVSTTSKTVFKAAGAATIKLRTMFGFKAPRSSTVLPQAPDQELPPYDLMRPSYRFEQAKMALKKSEEAHEDLRRIIMGAHSSSPASAVTGLSTTRRLAKLSRLDARAKKAKSSLTPGVRQSFSTPAGSVSPPTPFELPPPPSSLKVKRPKPPLRPMDSLASANSVASSESIDTSTTDPQTPPQEPTLPSKSAIRRARKKAAGVAAAAAAAAVSKDVSVASEQETHPSPDSEDPILLTKRKEKIEKIRRKFNKKISKKLEEMDVEQRKQAEIKAIKAVLYPSNPPSISDNTPDTDVLSTRRLESVVKAEIRPASLSSPLLMDDKSPTQLKSKEQAMPESSPSRGSAYGAPPDRVPDALHSEPKEVHPSKLNNPLIQDGAIFAKHRPVDHSSLPTLIPSKSLIPIQLVDIAEYESGSHQIPGVPENAEVSQSKEVKPSSDTLEGAKESREPASLYMDWLQNLPSVPSPDLIDLPPFEPYRGLFPKPRSKLSRVDRLLFSGHSMRRPQPESNILAELEAFRTPETDSSQSNSAILEHVLDLTKYLITIAERRTTFPRFKSPEMAAFILPMVLAAVRFAFDHRLDDIVDSPAFILIREHLEKLRRDIDAGGSNTVVKYVWPELLKDAKALQALTHPKRPAPKPSRSSRLSLKFTPASSLRRSQPSPRVRIFPKSTVLHGSISPSSVPLDPIPRTASDPPIAQLAHGLDRVLFNPAPYILQDPHTKVYNFDPYLQKIPKVDDFAFERVVGFIPSSKHSTLHRLARENGKSFVGSTSSLTSLLSHIYFLVSHGKFVDTSRLSRAFADAPRTFTPSARMPAAVIMHYGDGVYSTDSDKFEEELDTDDQKHHILMRMGTMLEHFLTRPPSDFSKLMKSTEATNVPRNEEAYQYTLTSNLVMRSQLDCVDSRLPGTGVFDIKTRAAVAIRLDLKNFEENSGYIIRSMTGDFESFEREHYDLARSGLLKYNFQARIGNMDGIFVAFHNTAHIQGFQYLNLADMDQLLFGDPGVGDAVFRMCVGLLERVNESIKKYFPSQSIKVIYDTNTTCSAMSVWVEPLDWDRDTPAPATEFTVTVRHFSDGQKTPKPQFGDPHWSCYYTIGREKPSIQTRARMDDARARQNLASMFPPDKPIPPPPSNVGTDTQRLRPGLRSRSRRAVLAHLRVLSHQGRSYTDQLAQSGQPTTMWSASDAPSSSDSEPPKKVTFWSLLSGKK